MTTIAFYSLATSNDTDELSSRIEFHTIRLSGDKPTVAPPTNTPAQTLEDLVRDSLDEVQRQTRTIVRTPSNPPSGKGSNTPTLPPDASDAESVLASLSIW